MLVQVAIWRTVHAGVPRLKEESPNQCPGPCHLVMPLPLYLKGEEYC